TVKDNDENSTTKYSVLETSSSTSSGTKRPTKINSPLWNTLQDGWLFNRKVDNSDIQFASFRDHYGALILALAVYLVLSHLYQFFLVPKSPAKFQSQPLIRTYFFLGFSIVFEGSIANPIITWIFNLGVLFLNETYGNYGFENLNKDLAFLDSNRGLITRWDVTFNICMLRLVSFNMDYYWSFHPSNNSPERNDRDLAPLTEKDRIIGPCFREDYNFIYYLSYALYAPLYLAGPIITYNNFIAQLRYPCEINLKETLIYGARLFVAIMIMEFMLHYTYVVAIVKSKAWEGDSPLELAMIGVLNLELVWLKWVDWPHYRHLCAVGAILNLLMMWAANLVGFVVGLDGMKVLFTNIFMTPIGLMELGIACIVLFGGAQILFEIREEEKRRGINSEIRY
ncbi:22521_t:CDS:2, partial [Racocetra persica]